MSGRAFVLCIAAVVRSSVGASVLASQARQSGGEAFMLMSGITSPAEMCLVSTLSSDLTLQPCASTVAAGNGRDIFSFQSNGQLKNVATKQCVGLPPKDSDDSGRVHLMDCDDAAANGGSLFEATESNQLKFLGDGALCLSQEGLGAGIVDVAFHAAAAATTTWDFVSHGANMAVGNEASGFWASRIGENSESVEFSIDFGDALLEFAEIRWEFPAKSFSFLVSSDGTQWTEAFATDVNVLNVSRVQLHRRASMAKVVMREPSPLTEHGIYGISSLSVFASQLWAVAQPCAKAAKSSDARDKIFFVHTGEFDPRPAIELRGELVAFATAQAGLASILSRVIGTIPKLPSCGLASASLAAFGESARAAVFGSSRTTAQDGLEMDDAKDLLRAARSLIGTLRESLL